jgi:hypothetical protein
MPYLFLDTEMLETNGSLVFLPLQIAHNIGHTCCCAEICKMLSVTCMMQYCFFVIILSLKKDGVLGNKSITTINLAKISSCYLHSDPSLPFIMSYMYRLMLILTKNGSTATEEN